MIKVSGALQHRSDVWTFSDSNQWTSDCYCVRSDTDFFFQCSSIHLQPFEPRRRGFLCSKTTPASSSQPSISPVPKCAAHSTRGGLQNNTPTNTRCPTHSLITRSHHQTTQQLCRWSACVRSHALALCSYHKDTTLNHIHVQIGGGFLPKCLHLQSFSCFSSITSYKK